MKVYRHTQRLMGSIFTLGIKHQSKSVAIKLLEEGVQEIQGLESLLSEYLPQSDITKINQSDQSWVQVDPITFGIISRSLDIAKMTQGTFDISIGALKDLYDFSNEHFEMPKSRHINKALQHVGYSKIQLDAGRQAVRLNQANMRISLAAIGKGFAADYLIRFWQSQGVSDAFVDASGDIKAIGLNEDDQAWTAGIADPDQPDQVLFEIKLQDHLSVATSGDSEQHFWYKDQKYSHNLNPKTGLPLVGLKSITIVSPSAELSDALSTAIYVMGMDQGIDFVNLLPNTYAIIIDQNHQVHFSNKIIYEEILHHTPITHPRAEQL